MHNVFKVHTQDTSMVYDPPCQAPAAANVPLCKKRSRLSRTHLATNLVNPTSPTNVAKSIESKS